MVCLFNNEIDTQYSAFALLRQDNNTETNFHKTLVTQSPKKLTKVIMKREKLGYGKKRTLSNFCFIKISSFFTITTFEVL